MSCSTPNSYYPKGLFYNVTGPIVANYFSQPLNSSYPLACIASSKIRQSVAEIITGLDRIKGSPEASYSRNSFYLYGPGIQSASSIEFLTDQMRSDIDTLFLYQTSFYTQELVALNVVKEWTGKETQVQIIELD